MIRINQLKLPVGHTQEQLAARAAKKLRIRPEEIRTLAIRRQSLDARKKPELFFSYVVDAELADEARERQLVRRAGDRDVSIHEEKPYRHIHLLSCRFFSSFSRLQLYQCSFHFL